MPNPLTPVSGSDNFGPRVSSYLCLGDLVAEIDLLRQYIQDGHHIHRWLETCGPKLSDPETGVSVLGMCYLMDEKYEQILFSQLQIFGLPTATYW